MMFNIQQLQNLAPNLLGSIGQEYTLTEEVQGPYDPEEGEATVTKTDWVFTGGVFNYTTKGSGDGIVYNRLIEQGDRKVLLVPRSDGVIPKAASWSITIKGEQWKVVAVETVEPADICYLIELQVRKR